MEDAMGLNAELLRGGLAVVVEREPQITKRFYVAGAWTEAYGAITSLMLAGAEGA